jgi:murein DD-endopeptidase MepM/ murein hydrolase activator NlpD
MTVPVRVIGSLLAVLLLAMLLKTGGTQAADSTPTANIQYVIVTATPTPNMQFVVVTNTPTVRPVTNTLVPPTPANSRTAIAVTATARILNFQPHFLLRRPFPDDLQNSWARNYSYGSADNGARRTHHGIDISNPLGTVALATAAGVVFYADKDILVQFGPQPNFYGNTVVILHTFNDSSGQPVYTLYGHLSRIDVRAGQVVQTGDPIGVIGATGVAAGTHLHVEVRLGDPTSYLATRNPELWLMPYPGRGVIAGKLLGEDGKPLYGVRIEAIGTGVSSFAYSYADDAVNGDTLLDENFVFPDLPEGEYRLQVSDQDLKLFVRQKVTVRDSNVTWSELRARLPNR